MSSSNRTGIRYCKEQSWGILPPTPQFKEFEFLSTTLGEQLTSARSNIIVSDRKLKKPTIVSGAASGNLDFEFSPINLDDFLAGVMANQWLDAYVQGTDISHQAPNLLVSSGSTDFVTAGFKPGMMIGVHGLEGPDDFWFERVVSVTSNQMEVTGTGTDVAEGNTVTINGSTLTDGVDFPSFSIEKALEDVNSYFLISGAMINTMSFSLTPAALITGSMSVIAKDGQRSDTPLSGDFTPAPGKATMNTSTNIASIKKDGNWLTDTYISNLSFQINNGMEGKQAIQHFGNVFIRPGDAEITGSMDIYFNDPSWYESFKQNESFSLRMQFKSEGFSYFFEFPVLTLTSHELPISGRNADVMDNVQFQASVAEEYGVRYQLRIDRIWDPREMTTIPWRWLQVGN